MNVVHWFVVMYVIVLIPSGFSTWRIIHKKAYPPKVALPYYMLLVPLSPIIWLYGVLSFIVNVFRLRV